MIFFSKKHLRFLRKNIFVSDTKLQNVQINEEEELKKEREEIEERSETEVNENKLKILEKWLFFGTRIKKEVKKKGINQKNKEEDETNKTMLTKNLKNAKKRNQQKKQRRWNKKRCWQKTLKMPRKTDQKVEQQQDFVKTRHEK